jgi:hypothetical protein
MSQPIVGSDGTVFMRPVNRPAHPHLGDGYVHFSNLRHIARSAAHYRVAVERRGEPTPTMRFGSLVHALVLGGVEIAVWHGTRRLKGYEDFEAENKGKLVVTADEHHKAILCANAVQNDPVAAPWLEGAHEQTILWQYQDRACSSRLDVIGPLGDLADLKTCSTSEPMTLMRACLTMGYHAQLAFYRRAAQSIGHPVRAARILAVETAPPFVVTVLTLSPRTLEHGEKLVRMWMERLLSCEAADQWPGYVQCEVPWDLDDAANDVVLIDGEEAA